MRRNLLIAKALVRSPVPVTVLLVTGAREASVFEVPRGVDCLTLPALRKEIDGQYQSLSLDISLHELVTVRAKTIRAAIEAFGPDVMIVDNVPRGALRELDPTLDYLRSRGCTHCVLGLRDVLDDPRTVRREWRRAANIEAILEHYDAVWIYGDPAVYDPVREYRFPVEVQAKTRYAGYLDQRMRLTIAKTKADGPLTALALLPDRLVLCLVGGGQDGARVAEAFARADLPSDAQGVILTGPFMPADSRRRLHHLAAMRPRLRVLEFLAEPALLLSRADRVIAMGGYNTICEVLSFEKHALIVPRVKPRQEQLIRAECLRNLGLLDVLHPDQVEPHALTEWLSRDLGPPPRVRERIDLHGLARLPALLGDVLGTPRHTAQRASSRRI